VNIGQRTFFEQQQVSNLAGLDGSAAVELFS
jgi:hypothetical protein